MTFARIYICVVATALAALLIGPVGVVATDASVRSAQPYAPADLGATPGNHGLQVEPETILYTGDGTGFLGGASAHQHSRIHWTEWTAEVALGTGFDQVNYCVPSCATGRFRGYRARIELWRTRKSHGALVFTRMTIFYLRARPRGNPQHYTFTDIFVNRPGGFGWGPPSAGYCTPARGLKPAVGCNNIHSLPRLR